MTFSQIINFDDGGYARVIHSENDCVVVAAGNDADLDMEFTKQEALDLAAAIIKHFKGSKR